MRSGLRRCAPGRTLPVRPPHLEGKSTTNGAFSGGFRACNWKTSCYLSRTARFSGLRAELAGGFPSNALLLAFSSRLQGEFPVKLPSHPPTDPQRVIESRSANYFPTRLPAAIAQRNLVLQTTFAHVYRPPSRTEYLVLQTTFVLAYRTPRPQQVPRPVHTSPPTGRPTRGSRLTTGNK